MSSEARLPERCVAAMGASIVSALVTNPFDLVKTRLQVQLGTQTLVSRPLFQERLALNLCPSCTRPLPPPSITPASSSSCASGCFVYQSSFDAMLKIVRREGFFVLWRGTGAVMMAQIPLVGIYMPLYESLLEQFTPSMGNYAPLAAGSVARSVSVLCVAPLELIRTRIQANKAPMGLGSGMGTGWRQMWRGVDATLARDIPFTMIYWTLVERIRKSIKQNQGIHKDDFSTTLYANVVAGSVAGSVAAVLTTPFDVAKTTVQAKSGTDGVGSVLRTIREISRAGGVQALFTGVGPRVTKIAPACAIVISMYEILKQALAGKLGT
eukprot:TRINITY_DN3422_c0_g1_i1.p1 TRINITY_DN3422_c0_g1~~TRINITY_DN3422_c0_g1_i1.p1  ORF type:complete len:336 (-),score=50.34 TRINITY_DN3422_c0_g1_i1:854-1825(-)